MDDLVLETTEEGQPYPIQIINNQVELIVSVLDVDDEIYDDLKTEKIMVMSKAFKLIHKAQKALDKFL